MNFLNDYSPVEEAKMIDSFEEIKIGDSKPISSILYRECGMCKNPATEITNYSCCQQFCIDCARFTNIGVCGFCNEANLIRVAEELNCSICYKKNTVYAMYCRCQEMCSDCSAKMKHVKCHFCKNSHSVVTYYDVTPNPTSNSVPVPDFPVDMFDD